MHTHKHTQTHPPTHKHKHKHTQTHTNTHTQTHTHKHPQPPTHTHRHKQTHTNTHTHTFFLSLTHTRTHTHTHFSFFFNSYLESLVMLKFSQISQTLWYPRKVSLAMDKLQLTGQIWAEFSTLEAAICMLCIFGVISKTAQLKVESSAQTTARLSPVSYHAPPA
jgi:hypothetical protein